MQLQRVCHDTLPWLISISLDLKRYAATNPRLAAAYPNSRRVRGCSCPLRVVRLSRRSRRRGWCALRSAVVRVVGSHMGARTDARASRCRTLASLTRTVWCTHCRSARICSVHRIHRSVRCWLVHHTIISTSTSPAVTIIGSNQSLQPTATRCAFTFFMIKTVPEIFSRALGSRG